jgi:hypothetical protein
MHAAGYRPRSSLVVLALVTLVALWVVTAPSSRSRSRCPAKARSAHAECSYSRAESVQLADGFYRGKRFDAAEHTLRQAARCEPIKIAEELHVIASFYRELGQSWMRAHVVPYRERYLHLDTAIQFDAMLGGIHADELSRDKDRVLWATGPE